MAVQPLGAGKVEKRLVDRERLDQRRQRLHHGAHLAADADIFFHVRRDDDRLGAGVQRLEHRHGRAHALDAGDVAGGRDDAALAAADDDRLVLQRRIVALLDRRVEGVAVDMGEMQPVELRMPDQARAAAALAACVPRRAAASGSRGKNRGSGSLTGAAIAANIKRTSQCYSSAPPRTSGGREESCHDCRHRAADAGPVAGLRGSVRQAGRLLRLLVHAISACRRRRAGTTTAQRNKDHHQDADRGRSAARPAGLR